MIILVECSCSRPSSFLFCLVEECDVTKMLIPISTRPCEIFTGNLAETLWGVSSLLSSTLSFPLNQQSVTPVSAGPLATLCFPKSERERKAWEPQSAHPAFPSFPSLSISLLLSLLFLPTAPASYYDRAWFDTACTSAEQTVRCFSGRSAPVIVCSDANRIAGCCVLTMLGQRLCVRIEKMGSLTD